MFSILNVIGLYELLLVIVGTFGNLLVFLVCLDLKNNTFILISFFSITDTISLYFWNLNHFTTAFFNLDLQNFNYYYCKFFQYFQFSSLQLSAWLLVFISFERYFLIKLRLWRTRICTPKRLVLASVLLTVVILVINFHTLFTFGYNDYINGTMIVICYATDIESTKIMGQWNTVHAFLYSYIPFCMISLANILLITNLLNKNKVSILSYYSARSNKQRNMNITTISVTILFIVLTSPGAIVSSYYNILIQSYEGTIVLFLADSLTFSYHALNFLILMLTNKQFYKKLVSKVFNRTFSSPSSSLKTATN